MFRFLGAKLAKMGPFGHFGSLRAHLGFILEHLGAKLGPRGVVLGASWAILPHFGGLQEAQGRHFQADFGFQSLDSELTCGKMATCQKL